MITLTCKCASCGSENIVKNGKNSSGNQRYKCNGYGTGRVPDRRQAHNKVGSGAIHRTYEERNSYRSTGRFFGVGHVTVFNWLKKSP